jgi:O-antigen ligase
MIQKIIAGLWIAAFLCALFFFNDYELESFALATVFLFSFSILSLSLKKEWHIPQSMTLLFMALFWILAFISLLHTEILNVSIMAFVYFSAMPLTFFVLILKNDETLIKSLAKIGAVIFTGLGLWALAQYFIFGDHFAGRAHHPLKNPNSLGALFNLGLFASVGWMLVTKIKIHSNLALILSVLLIGGIVATASRGALVAMIPMMGLMLFFLRDKARAHWKCLSILAVSGVVLFGFSVFGAAQNDTMIARMTDTLSMNLADSSSNRVSLWLATIDMINAHGLFGTGIGTYFQYFGEFRLPSDKWGTYYAHSDPLQYWVELGVLGPILFYAFCISVFLRTVRAVKKTKDDVQRAKILAPFFALGAIVLHTHVTFNFYNLSILYVSGFMLAVWFIATQAVLKTPTKTVSFPDSYSGLSRGAVISLPFLMIGFFFFAMMLSEQLTQRAKTHMMAGDLKKFGETTMAAQAVGLGHNYRADLLAVNLPLSLLAIADSFDREKQERIFNEGLFYIERAHAANPRSASALYYMGLLLEEAPQDLIPDRMKSSAEYYRQALKLDPLHFSARIALSKTLPAKEKVKLLEEGVHFRYNNPQALNLYMTLLSTHAQNGEAKKMKEITATIQNFQNRVERDREKAQETLF